jgi:hypothetical protein
MCRRHKWFRKIWERKSMFKVIAYISMPELLLTSFLLVYDPLNHGLARWVCKATSSCRALALTFIIPVSSSSVLPSFRIMALHKSAHCSLRQLISNEILVSSHNVWFFMLALHWNRSGKCGRRAVGHAHMGYLSPSKAHGRKDFSIGVRPPNPLLSPPAWRVRWTSSAELQKSINYGEKFNNLFLQSLQSSGAIQVINLML